MPAPTPQGLTASSRLHLPSKHLRPMHIASSAVGFSLASAGPKKTDHQQRTFIPLRRLPCTQHQGGTISAGDEIMWNSRKYTAMAVLGAGLAVAAATPASAWLPGYGSGGAYGYGGGCGSYGYAPAYGYGGGCGGAYGYAGGGGGYGGGCRSYGYAPTYGYGGGCGGYGAYGAYGSAPAYAGVYSYGWPYGIVGDVGYGAYGYAGGCGGSGAYGYAGGCGGYGAYGYAPTYGYAGGCGGYGAYGYAPTYGFAGSCRARRHHAYGGYALSRVMPRSYAYAAYISRSAYSTRYSSNYSTRRHLVSMQQVA